MPRELNLLPKGTRPFLTVREAADLLQLSDRTVRRWIKLGRLVACRTSGTKGKLRIPRDSIETFLQESLAQ